MSEKKYLPSKGELVAMMQRLPAVKRCWDDEQYKAAHKAKEAIYNALLKDKRYVAACRELSAITRQLHKAYDAAVAARKALITDIRLNGPTAANVAAVKKLLGVK